jgi:hypothetical protein
MIEILKLALIAYMFTALEKDKMIFSFYLRWINKLPDWLNYPLGKCYICFTGQVMFWYFIFTKDFNFFDLCFFVSAGIFMSMVYNHLYDFLNDY